MAPVGQPPCPVDRLDVPEYLEDVIAKARDHMRINQLVDAYFVVDLKSDDPRMASELLAQTADESLGVETECRVGEVDVLARAVWNRLTARRLSHHLGMFARSEERRVGKECRSRWS